MRYLKIIVTACIALALVCSVGTAMAQSKSKKKKEPKTAGLEGTYWSLYEMDGKTVETPADRKEVYIKLTGKKNGLEGYTGCNLISGKYEETREGLTFDPVMTEIACDDMTTEQYLKNALYNTTRYEINGLYLMLYNGYYSLAIFKAKFYDEK